MRVRRWRRFFAAAIVALAACVAPAAAQTVTHPYVGVTYIDRAETQPRAWHAHIIQIDLTSPGIRFKVSPPAGPREVVRQTTVEFLKAERAQVAINAHYFWPYPSTESESSIIGVAASEGRVYSEYETPVQSYALVADAPGLNIDASNHASIVRRGDAQPLWNTIAGSAQIVTNGVVTIPEYRDVDHANAQLTPGGPNNYSNANSWYEAVNARSAIGLDRVGRTLTLFTVDARGGSMGLRVSKVASILLRDYGVWNALNLDGGGSTSLAMEDPTTHMAALVNTSSDNPAGRAVGSSLAVFAQGEQKAMQSRHLDADAPLNLDPRSALWSAATPVIAEVDPFGAAVAGHRTEIRSRWTEQYLYVLFICPYETLNLKPAPTTKEETNLLWNWDVAEAFIGTDNDHIRHYREFQVSPQGEWVDLDINREPGAKAGGWEWKSGMEVLARIDPVSKIWYGAMKIPLAAFDAPAPRDGTEWRMNLYRLQGPEADRKYICWLPTGAINFHLPEKFGRLRFVR